MDDEELMREVLALMIDDTSRQVVLLDAAIREHDPKMTMRLAHYCKGACANVGANALASVLVRLEKAASLGSFDECAITMSALTRELERLKVEAEAVEREL